MPYLKSLKEDHDDFYLEHREIGSLDLPHFFQITAGIRHKSLIYHAQIGKKYYTYSLKNLSAENLNLTCSKRSCPAKALVKLPKSSCLVIEKPTGRPNGKGNICKTYKLNYEDPRLRDLSEYIFCQKKSQPHNCQT